MALRSAFRLHPNACRKIRTKVLSPFPRSSLITNQECGGSCVKSERPTRGLARHKPRSPSARPRSNDDTDRRCEPFQAGTKLRTSNPALQTSAASLARVAKIQPSVLSPCSRTVPRRQSRASSKTSFGICRHTHASGTLARHSPRLLRTHRIALSWRSSRTARIISRPNIRHAGRSFYLRPQRLVRHCCATYASASDS